MNTHSMYPRKKTPKAFTMIEMILVVVIIALLATLVMRQYAGRTLQAREAAAKGQISSFKGALQNFEMDFNRYPTTAEGLRALIEKPVDLPPNAKWKKYLDSNEIPKDPWGNEYIYRCPGTVNTSGFDLSSPGPDGKPGTEDDL